MNECRGQMGLGHPDSIQGGFAAAVPLGRVGVEPYGRELVGVLKALLQAHSPTLELGAATGILTGQLTRARVGVLACESEELSLSQLRRSLPHVPAVCADVAAIPLRQSSVGSVLFVPRGSAIAAGSLQGRFSGGHLGEGDASGRGDWKGRVDERELERVLRTGGLFIEMSPDGSSTLREVPTPEWPMAQGVFTPVESRPFDDTVVHVWRVGSDV